MVPCTLTWYPWKEEAAAPQDADPRHSRDGAGSPRSPPPADTPACRSHPVFGTGPPAPIGQPHCAPADGYDTPKQADPQQTGRACQTRTRSSHPRPGSKHTPPTTGHASLCLWTALWCGRYAHSPWLRAPWPGLLHGLRGVCVHGPEWSVSSAWLDGRKQLHATFRSARARSASRLPQTLTTGRAQPEAAGAAFPSATSVNHCQRGRAPNSLADGDARASRPAPWRSCLHGPHQADISRGSDFS